MSSASVSYMFLNPIVKNSLFDAHFQSKDYKIRGLAKCAVEELIFVSYNPITNKQIFPLRVTGKVVALKKDVKGNLTPVQEE